MLGERAQYVMVAVVVPLVYIPPRGNRFKPRVCILSQLLER